MNAVEVWLDDAALGDPALVGYLRRHQSRTGDTASFEYSVSWLDNTCATASFALGLRKLEIELMRDTINPAR